jgi:hypothetical protein
VSGRRGLRDGRPDADWLAGRCTLTLRAWAVDRPDPTLARGMRGGARATCAQSRPPRRACCAVPRTRLRARLDSALAARRTPHAARRTPLAMYGAGRRGHGSGRRATLPASQQPPATACSPLPMRLRFADFRERAAAASGLRRRRPCSMVLCVPCSQELRRAAEGGGMSCQSRPTTWVSSKIIWEAYAS